MAKAVMEKEAFEKERDEALKLLRQFGRNRSDEQETLWGTQFMAPQQHKKNFDYVIQWWIEKKKEYEEPTDFSRQYDYRPWDMAVAVESAILTMTGSRPLARTMFFERAKMVTVPTGVKSKKSVRWGKLQASVFEGGGVMQVTSTNDADENLVGKLVITTAKINEDDVMDFFDLVQHLLETESIYRGKVVDGSEMPKFIDTSTIQPELLVFNPITERQIKANLIVPLTRPDVLKELGVEGKNNVLLSGAWGTGKSETARWVMKVCEQIKRTCIVCNPKDNNVLECIDFAAMYQPATVIIEDIDVLASKGDSADVQAYLDKFDGHASKGKDISMVMTTNYPEKIHKAMLRAGRVDTHIPFGTLEQEPAIKLIKLQFPDYMVKQVDFDQVYTAISHFAPAFIVDMTKKVKRYAAQRAAENGGGIKRSKIGGKINLDYETLDFLAAAEEVAAHNDLHKSAGEGEKTPTLDRAFRESVLQALDGNVREVSDDSEYTALLMRVDKK